jgi:hypothetical protein
VAFSISETGVIARVETKVAGRAMSGPAMATVRLWRTVAGAAIGVVCSLVLTPFAGMAWGAIIQAAPCYGGAAERSLVERVMGGAFFGMLAFVEFYGGYSVLAGLVAGAVAVNLLPRARLAATRRVLNFLYPQQADRRAPQSRSEP